MIRFESAGLSNVQPSRDWIYKAQQAHAIQDAVNHVPFLDTDRLGADALENVGAWLLQHPKLHDADWRGIEPPYEDLAPLRGLVREWAGIIGPDLETVQVWLEELLDERSRLRDEAEADNIAAANRREILNGFLEQIRRADAHASREVDRTIKRYFSFKSFTSGDLG